MDLDQALIHYQGTHPLWDLSPQVRDLVNHGPMASEALDALVQLGELDDAGPHLLRLQSSYAQGKLRPLDPPQGAERPARLGQGLDQWTAYYLGFSDPIALLKAELPLLSPGVLGASLHGLLRSAHGLRAWQRDASEPRRREIAFGLGLWASSYQALPGTPGRTGGSSPLALLTQTPVMDPSIKRKGLIGTRALAVQDWPGFVPAVEAMELHADSIPEVLGELSAWAARRMLVESGGFGYLHALTASSSARCLLALLEPAQAVEALGHLLAALLAVHASTTSGAPEPAIRPQSTEGLVQAALERGNDHGIKLVEAVLREQRLGARPERVAAAWRVVGSQG